ncbi:MAG: hypothetical protein KKF62_00070 [Bacteroidetes bacterium]|nr:hypothetical protein [Bacteroidota bacterium]MBU1116234.1 hypothetical protein [Bacteroidota bacterium]MBU1799742.1 hypothetical protein [Bacteroidota bacterium]
MSWLLGEVVKGKNKFSDFNKISNEKVFHSFSNNNINLVSGGNSRNLYSFNISNRNIFVAGIGIDNSGGINKVMDKKDWEISLKKGIEKTLNLDGHYVIIIVEDTKVEIFTDKLGLRDIYIRELDDRIIFSTKIKLLTYFGNLEINFAEFSSRWLLFNQISQESVFKDCKRLVAGKSASINIDENCKVTYGYNNFEFSEKPFDSAEYESRLTSLVNLNISKSEKLSLSLSGGMDSRVILSILLKNRKEFFETHSFGNPSHPDSQVAKQITDKLNIQHHQYNSTNDVVDDLIMDIENYTTETVVNNAASAIMQLKNYKYLSERNLVVIDGGFGEIWRREFFYKLLIKGRKALLSGNIDEIISYLTLPRADIFSEDVILEMKNGVKNQLSNIFDLLPKINKNNIEDWLDHFALLTRLPNYYSHEQTRLDEMITAVMPFVQQSLISNLFGVEIRERKNGRLFKKIIKRNSSELTDYDLVKGTTKHPYYLNSLQSRLWSIMIKKLGKDNRGVSNTDILLKLLKEYIYDNINSKSITESSIYDKTKIQNLVNDYYSGTQKNGYSVDWLLAFILFNRSMSR